jgi:hypothetical protein
MRHLLSILLCLSFCMPATAADKDLKVKPSKVSSAKGRDREKQFTKWMPQREMEELVDAKWKEKQQLVYFEYHEGKDAYRSIFSSAILFRGYYWNAIYGEDELIKQIISNKKRGLETLFVVLEGNYYRTLFVKPEQLDAARQIIQDLGIEPPVLK